MNCPKCGGEVWDNRSKKAAGGMKPNAPDFSCKAKDACGWVQWPEKGQKAVSAPQIVQPGAAQPQGVAFQAGRDAALLELFWDCFDNVLAGIAKRKLADWAKPETVAALTATQYIQRAKG